jgi:multidrug efflux pump subunit AcrA (membrane-fusion protein)
MELKAELPILEKKNILLLPMEAVKQINGKHFVFLPGRKYPKMVEIGVTGDQFIEITENLKENEQVIINMSLFYDLKIVFYIIISSIKSLIDLLFQPLISSYPK